MEDPSAWVYEEHPRAKYDAEKHKSQRAEYGFSTYDWWNFDSYLSYVIIGGLEKFKDGHGFPVYGGCESMDDWREILDKIIAGFKARELLDNDYPKPEEREVLEARWAEGSALFIKFYPSLWD